MAIEYMLLMLAGAPATDPRPVADPTKVTLVCRYEATMYPFMARRKMCLTAPEWDDLDKNRGNASRDVLRKYLSNGTLPMG